MAACTCHYEHGPRYREGETWFRRDVYRPTGNPQRVFVTGPNDQTCQHNSQICYGGDYDARCACCFLGFAHSDAKHTQAMENFVGTLPPPDWG